MTANTPPGPATDASGQAVVDPTKNVLDALDGAVARLDDLSERDRQHGSAMRKLTSHYEKRLHKAESKAIASQFKIWEANRVEQKTDTKVAVDAALSAAKEAVGKNEIFVKEQLAQQSSTTSEQIKAQGDKLEELKTRFERTESGQAGAKAQSYDAQAKSGNTGLWLGVIAASFLGFLSFLLGLGTFIVLLMNR